MAGTKWEMGFERDKRGLNALSTYAKSEVLVAALEWIGTVRTPLTSMNTGYIQIFTYGHKLTHVIQLALLTGHILLKHLAMFQQDCVYDIYCLPLICLSSRYFHC